MIEFIQNMDPDLYDFIFRVVQDALIIAGVAAALVLMTRGIH